KAKKPGKATITASAGGKVFKVKVTVLKKKTSVKVTSVSGKVPKTLKVSHGPYWVTGKWKSSKAPGVVVKFSSTKKKVAAIDKAGLLTPRKPGKAVIKVKAGTKTHAYKIKVKK
ncbi:MAG: hypothetical protein LBM66_07340, partial [Bifidobacteriaceae bacterium]|nr:hypothetical protein [Bifidobacteriaceae bacterium]